MQAVDAQFEGWAKLLIGQEVALHPDTPLSGYYRVRDGKDGPMVAVAIWRDLNTNDLHVTKKGDDVSPDAVWPYCAKHPISYELFTAVTERGEPWPEQMPADASPGHNQPPAESTFETLRDEIKLRADQALALITAGAAKTLIEADQATDLVEKLSALAEVSRWPAGRRKAPIRRTAECDQAEVAPRDRHGRHL